MILARDKYLYLIHVPIKVYEYSPNVYRVMECKRIKMTQISLKKLKAIGLKRNKIKQPLLYATDTSS